MDVSLPAFAAASSAAPAVAAIAPAHTADEVMAVLLSTDLLTEAERAQVLTLPPPIRAALLEKIAASKPKSAPIIQLPAIKLPSGLQEARTPVSAAKRVPPPPKPAQPLPEAAPKE